MRLYATIGRYHALVQQYGWRRCLYRLGHNGCRKLGLLASAFPAWPWAARPLSRWLRPDIPGDPEGYWRFRQAHEPAFFFACGQPPPLAGLPGELAEEETERLLAGQFRYFRRRYGTLGYPSPRWLTNPFTGQTASASQHWAERADFDEAAGDIKYYWEPSRFSWVFALTRVYGRTRDCRCAEAFWQLFESWLEANAPQLGPNWQCGQEVALRALAVVWAAYGFGRDPATTPARLVRLAVFLAASAERIAGNIRYARAQMGNHATSEAAGLYAIGVLFPELRGAARWQRLGRSVLEDEARRFNWPDGSYTQHSVNYQRLMLHAYLWSLRLAELHGDTFSAATRERIRASYLFLYQLQDEGSGRLPNYGPNDGALALALSDVDYLDYRPVLGALHFLFTRQRLYPPGPWDEEMHWLFGTRAKAAPVTPPPRRSCSFLTGGYFTLRGACSWALVRCHSYRTRPNQADMLHLDLWWHGRNLLRDSGTYTYYDPEHRWHLHFVGTAAHNTVVVGGEDQMVKGPRFQWHSLVRSRFLGRAQCEDCEAWRGEHDGYRRRGSSAIHRRTVARLGDVAWLIVDDVLGTGEETVALWWQLAELPWQQAADGLVAAAESGTISLRVWASQAAELWYGRGEDSGTRGGWESLYYGEKTPAPALRVSSAARLPLRFITLVGLTEDLQFTVPPSADTAAWTERAAGDVRVQLGPLTAGAPDPMVIRRGDAWEWVVQGLEPEPAPA